jgi:hypothetical protein
MPAAHVGKVSGAAATAGDPQAPCHRSGRPGST